MALNLTPNASTINSLTCVPCCDKFGCCNIDDLPEFLYVTLMPFVKEETITTNRGFSFTSAISFPGLGPIPLIKKSTLINNVFYDPNNFPTSRKPAAMDPGSVSQDATYVFEYIDPALVGQGDFNGGPFNFNITELKKWDILDTVINDNGNNIRIYAGPDSPFFGFPTSYEDPLAFQPFLSTRTIKVMRLYCVGTNYTLEWMTQANDGAGFFVTNNTAGQIHPEGNKVLSSCTPFFAKATGTRWYPLHNFSSVYDLATYDFIRAYVYAETYLPNGPVVNVSRYRTKFVGDWKAIITE